MGLTHNLGDDLGEIRVFNRVGGAPVLVRLNFVQLEIWRLLLFSFPVILGWQSVLRKSFLRSPAIFQYPLSGLNRKILAWVKSSRRSLGR